MDPAIRCPQCHNGITPGALACPFCGHSMRDPTVVIEEKRTWQETCYLVASVILVLHGAMWLAIGLGAFEPVHYAGYAFFAYVGGFGMVLGICLYRCQAWAQWVARGGGVVALLTYGQWSLSFGLAIGVMPFALERCLFWGAWFFYWIFLEYLIWAVSE